MRVDRPTRGARTRHVANFCRCNDVNVHLGLPSACIVFDVTECDVQTLKRLDAVQIRLRHEPQMSPE